MSQASLELILSELRMFRTEVNEEFQAVRTELREEFKEGIQHLRSEFSEEIQHFRSEFVQEFKTFKKDQQATLNRLNSQEKLNAQLVGLVKSVKETVTEIAERQDAHERKFSFELHTHATSIDILNREQLVIKTEIEMLKNRY